MMTRMQATALSLVLTMPVLGAPHVAAADSVRAPSAHPAAKSSISSFTESTTVSTEQQDATVDKLFELYKSARSNGMLGEADTLAKKIVDASIRTHGIDSKVTAVALTNLAMLQTSGDENVSAIQNFTMAIGIVEDLDDRLSANLIVPLKGLGRAEIQAGNLDRARVALYRALHISHVNFGPHNYEQIETLYTIANLLYDAGLPEEAYKVRKRILYLYTRNAALRDDDRLPST